MRKGSTKVFGVGINDADYVTQESIYTGKVNGKWKKKMVWRCEYYTRWRKMIERCYSEKYQEKQPTYIGVKVCDEWLIFSNFKSWMEKQDWKGNQLDKDFLSNGVKIYSPETCAFIPKSVNSFISDRARCRGEYPLGVSINCNRLRAKCQNPFTGKEEHLGYFDCPNEAHLAWKSRKHELAIMIAESGIVSDERVNRALREMYR